MGALASLGDNVMDKIFGDGKIDGEQKAFGDRAFKEAYGDREQSENLRVYRERNTDSTMKGFSTAKKATPQDATEENR